MKLYNTTFYLTLLFISFCFTAKGEALDIRPFSGVIVDSLSNQPIEYVSVALYEMTNKKLAAGTITNSKGEYSIILLPGKYFLRSSFVGYKTKTTPIDLLDPYTGKIQPIALNSSTTSLNEVQVTGKLADKQMSIEKTRINVSQNISSVSGNITDVLKSQSSINIDADNTIYLRGNSNILVLLDGRPTTVTSLNTLPSSNIENIEIITNPDAKYDSEGTGGIINIVSKKQSASGFSGTATINYGIDHRVNGGLGLNYSKGIWSTGFTYNGRVEESNVKSYLTRQLYTLNTTIEQNAQSILKDPTHVFGLNLTAKPNNKNLYSLSLKSVLFDNSTYQDINGTKNSNLMPEPSYKRTNDVTWSRRTIEGAISYKRTFEKNKNELSFDAMYSATKGRRTGNYRIEDVYLQKSDAGGTPTNMALQVDYLKQICKTGRIETGLKAFSRWNSFESHFYDKDLVSNDWVLNPAYSDKLDHKEYIYSSYLMYSDSLYHTLFYKIGARVEYSTSELIQRSTNENINSNYFFPSPFLLLNYPISSSQNVALSLNRRVTRPTYPQLNPYIVVIDDITYETGNHDLIPETVDKIELNHSLVKEKIEVRTNLYYSSTSRFITPVSYLSPTNNLIISYANGSKQLKAGIDVDANYKFNKVLSINPTISLFHTKAVGSYQGIDLSTNGTAWTGNLKLAVKPDKATAIQLFINYNSPIALPQFKLSEIYYTDFALKRTILKNKMALSLTVTDLFNTRQWVINTNNNVYKLYNKSKSDTRVLWLGLTYNFNSYKSSNSQKKESAESDGGLIKLGQ